MYGGTREQMQDPIWTRKSWLAGLGRLLRTHVYGVLSDEDLVSRARSGDHAAFDALATRHRGRIYSMALGFLGTEAKAGEALCEIMLSAFRSIDSIGANCTPRAWLYLHGLRTVFDRLHLPPGRYTVESRPVRDGASTPVD